MEEKAKPTNEQEVLNHRISKLEKELAIANKNVSSLLDSEGKSESKYKTLFEGINDAVFVMPLLKEGFAQFLEVNDVACKRLGYTKEELLTLSPKEISAPVDVKLHGSKEGRNRLMQNKWSIFEAVHITKNGNSIPVEISSRIFDFEGKMVIMSLARDISERKDAETKLRVSEEKNRSILNAMNDFVFVLDTNNRFEAFYAPKEDLYLSPEMFLGKTHAEVMPLDINEKFEIALVELKKKGVANYEYQLEIDNKTEWFSMKLSSLMENGEYVGAVAVARNITEQKHLEEKLRSSEEKFRTLVTDNEEIVFIIAKDGRFLLSEGKGLATLGLQAGDVVGKSVFDLYKDYPEMLEEMKKAFAGETVTYEVFVAGVYFRNWYTPHRDKKGDVIGLLGLAVNITDRKNVEASLRFEKEFSEKIIETSSAIIVGLDKNHLIRIFNKGAELISGYTKEEVIGKDWFKTFFPKEQLEEMNKVWESAWGTTSHSYINPILTKSKKEKIISWQTTGIYDDKDEKNHLIVSIGNDITEKIEAEGQIKMFKTFAETSSQGMGWTKLDGTIIYTNSSLSKLLKETNDKNLLGKNIVITHYPANEQKRLKEEVFPILMKVGRWSGELTMLKANGELIETHNSLFIIKDKNLEPLFIGNIITDISKRKLAELKLKDSEHKFRLLADYTFDWEYWVDQNGKYVYISPSCERISGYSPEEFMSNSELLFEIVKEEYVQIVRNHYKDENNANTEIYSLEFPITTKDGNELWIEHNCRAIFSEDGKYVGRRGNNRDITDRKLADKKLKENEKRLKEAQKIAKLGSWEWDLVTHEMNWSDEMLNIYGIDKSEKPSAEIQMQLTHDDDKHIVEKALKSAFGKEILPSIEYRIVLRDSTIKYIVGTASRIYDKSGNTTKVFGTVQDITERKKAEELLQFETARLMSILNAIPDGVYIVNKDYDIEYINPVINREFGAIDGRKCYKYFHDLKEPCTWCKNEAVYNGETVRWEWLSPKNNRHYDLLDIPFKNSDGTVSKFEIFHDITDSKQAEEALKASEERYRVTTDATGDVYYSLNYDGMVYEYIHPNVERLTGYTLDEVDLHCIILKVERGGKTIGMEEIKERRKKKDVSRFTADYLIKTKSGKEKWITDTSFPYFDEDGVEKGSYGILSDITYRKEMENEIFHSKEKAENADKMKSIFLAQMSHEIRTPINALVSMSSLLRYDFEEGANTDQLMSFDIIDRAGGRIIRTIDLLLNLSEIQAGTYEISLTKFDVFTEVISQIIAENKLLAKKKNIDLNLIYSVENSDLVADHYTINQIFVQLIDNAIKYTEEGKIDVKILRNKSKMLVVEIIDTGIGIEESYLPHLFEPFSQEEMGYTRKYEGNGIGLALVKTYCKLNKAKIEVESKKGVGSTFRIIFES